MGRGLARSRGATAGRRLREESGQTVILIVGFAVVVLMLVTVVANASKAFLVKRSLSSWADGAAVVAAQSVAEDAVYSGEVADVLPLSQAAARGAVADYAARHGLAGRFDGFRVVEVTVHGPGRVTVSLATTMPLVFANELAPAHAGGVPVTASATALAPLS